MALLNDMTRDDFDDISVQDLECCGLKEFDGIINYPDPAMAILALCAKLSDSSVSYGIWGPHHFEPANLRLGQMPFAHLIMSQAGKETYGMRLAKFIRANKLGRVTSGPPNRNPNTGNQVKVFIWTPNKPAIRKFWQKEVRQFRSHIKKQAQLQEKKDE